jgi:peptide/nickel transport system ATP-binding protein
VGIDSSAASKYPHEFSGGERQRVCIARSLAARPQILVCDEAVSALDLSIRAQVLDLLAELKKKYNLSILFITHDLGVVKHFCERVIVMNEGKVVESGSVVEIFSSPKSAYTKLLLDSALRIAGANSIGEA